MLVVIVAVVFIGILGLGLSFSAGRMVGRIEERTKRTVNEAKQRQQQKEKPEEADYVEVRE